MATAFVDLVTAARLPERREIQGKGAYTHSKALVIS